MKIASAAFRRIAHNMVPKNKENGRISNVNARATRHLSKVSPRQGSPHQRTASSNVESSQARLNSAQKLSKSPQGQLRPSLSPALGQVAGHYAGCKFTEPPQPSALPLPPQNWTQYGPVAAAISHRDIVHQMSMMLNVQA